MYIGTFSRLTHYLFFNYLGGKWAEEPWRLYIHLQHHKNSAFATPEKLTYESDFLPFKPDR